MRKFEGFQKGVNLGGWISQFAEYDLTHFGTFITEKDIAEIASLGFDHVRVPVDYNVLETEEGELIPGGMAYLVHCHEWCRAHGLNMIIDLHECYGYSFDPLKKNMDRAKFFRDEALQARFLALWEEIALLFRDDPDHVAFEPLNEVVLFEVADDWNAVIRKYVKLIRSICPKHYIILGGVNYNSVTTVKLLEAPVDDRIVYNFHCYEPMVFTHQGAYWMDWMPRDFRIDYPKTLEEYRQVNRALCDDTSGAIFAENAGEMGPQFFENIFAPAIAHAEKYDVPLYCGEYGVIDLADNRAKIRWLKDIHTAFAKYGIGHALWNYKEKDFGFCDDSFASVRQEFIDCL
ncbi:MAG: cellulase family glycosylhydrolase [Clostridia bacterium]|nr:cellulase family glycosylhydrolase [Clostridia bacterium]